MDAQADHLTDGQAMTNASEPSPGVNSSTQRVRDFRVRQRKLGARPSGMVLSSRAQLAIDVIKSVRGQMYNVRAMEEALVNEARRLCSCSERIDQLVETGKLTGDLVSAWRETLSLVDVEETAKRDAQANGCEANPAGASSTRARKRKLPLDLRLNLRTK